MSEMVERVARALCELEGAKWDAKHFGETTTGQTPEEQREGYRIQANTAILAMREPTSFMLESANWLPKEAADDTGIWQCMIDAALK